MKENTCVSFAHYYQPNASVQFAYSVDWIAVKEKNHSILLVGKKGLYCKPFDVAGNACWESSSLREWLNTEWVTRAFSHGLECLLVPVNSSAPLDVKSLLPYHKPDDGFRPKSTAEDYVFLLSANEITDLLSPSMISTEPHWIADRTVIESNHTVKYWTRPVENSDVNVIDEAGNAVFCSPDTDHVFVRPAVWIDNFFIQRCYMDAISLWKRQVDNVRCNAFNYEEFRKAATAAFDVLYLYSKWVDTIVSVPKLVTEMIILIAKYSELHIKDETPEHLLSVNAAESLCNQSTHWNTIYNQSPAPGQPGAMKNGFIMRGLDGDSIVVDATTFDMMNPMDKVELSRKGFFTL